MPVFGFILRLCGGGGFRPIFSLDNRSQMAAKKIELSQSANFSPLALPWQQSYRPKENGLNSEAIPGA
jgi:hypothetical protein